MEHPVEFLLKFFLRNKQVIGRFPFIDNKAPVPKEHVKAKRLPVERLAQPLYLFPQEGKLVKGFWFFLWTQSISLSREYGER